jgi:hypothetical protein
MKVHFIINGDGFEMREATSMSETLASEGYETELHDWENSETESLVSIYDIYSTPAVLVTTDTGGLVEVWQGTLPRIDEIKHQVR